MVEMPTTIASATTSDAMAIEVRWSDWAKWPKAIQRCSRARESVDGCHRITAAARNEKDAQRRDEKRETEQREERRAKAEPRRTAGEAEARDQRRENQQAHADGEPAAGARARFALLEMADAERLDGREHGGFARGKPGREQDRAEAEDQRGDDGPGRDEEILDAGEDVERRDGLRDRADELSRHDDAEDEAEQGAGDAQHQRLGHEEALHLQIR